MKRFIWNFIAAPFAFSLGCAVASVWFALNPTQQLEESSKSNLVVLPARNLESPNYFVVFRDFNYVGDSQLSQVGTSFHQHEESQLLPPGFHKGVSYTFHYNGLADSKILLEVLQARLEAYDLSTQHEWVFNKDREHPVMVRFRGRGYEGWVRADNPTQEHDGRRCETGEDLNDYVLYIAKSPLEP